MDSYPLEVIIGNMDFSAFHSLRADLGLNPVSDQWLQWFVGLCEGQGYFSVTSTVPGFVLTFEHLDILQHINKVLDFGTYSYTDTGRWKVYDLNGLQQLIHILSHNLSLPHRVEGLNALITAFNDHFTERYDALVESILFNTVNTVLLPTLATAWLSGFTDGAGSFHLTHTLRGGVPNWKWRFRLENGHARDLFVHLCELFSIPVSSVHTRKARGTSIPQLNIGASNLHAVQAYYTRYPLKVKNAQLQRLFATRDYLDKCKMNKVPKNVSDAKLLIMSKGINNTES